MNIAVDISPLTQENSEHKVRGVGSYIEHLREELITSRKHTFHFFSDKNEIPFTPDLIHYPFFDPFFFAVPFRKPCPIVVTVHDVTPLLFPMHFPVGLKGKVKWRINKLLLSHVNGIITISSHSKNDICRISGINPERVDVAYLAAGKEFVQKKISSEQKEIFGKRYLVPEKFALYVGDGTWNKNLSRLLHAIEIAKIPLVIVGKALNTKETNNHPWNKDLNIAKSIIKESDLITTVGFLPKEDLVTIYNLATLLVMPSLYEGFGLPVVEAMQSGCPVLTSKEGALPEVGGDAVYYVDAFSEKEITQGLKVLFANTTLQKELSEKGLKQAKKFSWARTAKDTISLYDKLL